MRKTFWGLGAALVLAGCMLPQPDTPIIPPGAAAPQADRAQPNGDATMAGPATAPVEVATPMPATDGLFSGRISGATARAIVANPEQGGKQVRQELGSDGRFDLTLEPGVYRIEVVVGDRVATLADKVAIAAGDEREVTLVITSDPLAVTLEAAQPDEAASAAADGV